MEKEEFKLTADEELKPIPMNSSLIHCDSIKCKNKACTGTISVHLEDIVKTLVEVSSSKISKDTPKIKNIKNKTKKV